jgi:hypothetical protein
VVVVVVSKWLPAIGHHHCDNDSFAHVPRGSAGFRSVVVVVPPTTTNRSGMDTATDQNVSILHTTTTTCATLFSCATTTTATPKNLECVVGTVIGQWSIQTDRRHYSE